MEDISEEVTGDLKGEEIGLPKVKETRFLEKRNNTCTRPAVGHGMSEKLKEGWSD